MLTPKIILYVHKTYADNTHPIMLQYVKNGKPIRKVLGRCKKQDWLKSTNRVSSKNIEAPRINNDIEYALKNFGITKVLNFKAYFENIIENYRLKEQVSRHDVNKVVLAQLLEFDKDVDFEDITESFIYKFAAFLRDVKKNNPNSIKEKMHVLGKVLSGAKKAKMIKENALDDITFNKQRSTKTKLNVSEIQQIMSLELSGKMAESRDIFIASIFLRGIRIGDLITLKASNIIDNRLVYEERKTGKIHNIGIVEALKNIIDRWMVGNEFDYIFSFMDTDANVDKFIYKKAVKNAISKLSRYLKIIGEKIKITKNISPHAARHFFSKIANSTIKDTSITKDLIGHSSLAIHEGYISEISDDLVMDEYAEKVLENLKASQ
ncbi:tyrosine-type recombinase/integrase [Pedobacter sp. HDW13]|uniref:tyrosine-type recombinase/integrase n=1 Tax=Pedobacter sp. HDW13 TaxID=2714940 RepID=UPI001409D8E6|nr:site-specific integrase [Pedobacter sp. HDW13]QIL41036.1 tyrosine-type recombinase/integrase [Pedobacter sp. HDW13]